MVNEDRLPAEIVEFGERRMKKRFRIEQEVLYKALARQSMRQSGVGTLIDISSSGVCFTTQHALQLGMAVELAINWPVLLCDSCPMKLMIQGHVIRSCEEAAVLEIDSYEFRTQGSRGLQQSMRDAKLGSIPHGRGGETTA